MAHISRRLFSSRAPQASGRILRGLGSTTDSLPLPILLLKRTTPLFVNLPEECLTLSILLIDPSEDETVKAPAKSLTIVEMPTGHQYKAVHIT
jgi:hypothetical protein